MRGCEARDNGVEPEDDVGGPIPKMKRPLECMPRVGDVTKAVQANWMDYKRWLDPRQALEHFKSPIFYKISLESFVFDALGYKSWLETLDA